MTIIFLTDEQAKRLEITDAPHLTVKRYPLAITSVVMDNAICSEGEFVERLGKTALEILRGEK